MTHYHRLLGFLALPALLLAFTACDSNKEDELTDRGVLPSAEFTIPTLAAESHEADIVRYIITTPDAEFESVELLGDGTYIVARAGAAQYTASQDKAPARRQAPARHANRTSDYYLFGTYETIAAGEHYILNDLGELQITHRNGEGVILTITNHQTGRTSTFIATPDNLGTVSDATAALCRTWDYSYMDTWGYLSGKLLGHFKYIGGDNPRFEGQSDFLDDLDDIGLDFMDDLDEMPQRVVFTRYHTYYVTYNDGSTLVSTWQWSNESQGILYYDWKLGGDDSGYTTARFAGKQLRLYEDYKYVVAQIIIVNTLAAAQ